jgi:hypothetical protein
MTSRKFVEIVLFVTTLLATPLVLCNVVQAQTAKAQGLITGRSGETMTLQTQDSSNDHRTRSAYRTSDFFGSNPTARVVPPNRQRRRSP